MFVNVLTEIKSKKLDKSFIYKVPFSLEEKIAMIKRHYNLLKQDKNEKTALLEMRTNILYYFSGMPNSKEYKIKVCKCQTEEELFNLLDQYLNENKQ